MERSLCVVGVDACKTGWVAVVLREGALAEAHHLPVIGVLGSVAPDAQAVGIDIPIGLPERGFRAADREARRFVGGSSVFQVPCRAVLQAATHAEATALSVELCGTGISQQAYRLGPKIFEVEAWIPTVSCGVYEVHPEAAFAVALGRRPSASKKTWAGMIERRNALAGLGISLDHADGPAAARAAVDDMLDAGIVAWTARRILAGEARTFPATPETDDAGRPVAIWA